MSALKLAAAALLAGLSAAAPAQDPSDLARQIVNDPGNPQVDGAAARLVDDSAVKGGKALRVQVSRKGKNPWDASVGGEVLKPVKAGDKLILIFQARLEHGDKGVTTATLPYAAVQLAAAPYTTVISGGDAIGSEWKTLQVTGKADRDYPAKALKISIQLATARQTLDFGPIVLLDQGQ
jgi:hypothetical protein